MASVIRSNKVTVTKTFQSYLSLFVVCVCVLLIYIISISILCVSQGGLSLDESKQQIYEFYKWITLKSKDIEDLGKVNFCINGLFIQCNIVSYCVHTTGGVNRYGYVFVSLCILCVFEMCVCDIKSEYSKNHIIRVKPSVNFMPCCIKHTTKCY